ncbi:MAG TPA: hypothetical protein VIN72_00645 [Lutibacter sp.]
MEKCNEYLKELKDLYLDFDSLKDAPFMFFSLSASDLLHKIKMDVDNSYVNKSADAFSRYSKMIETKLGELPYDRAKDLTPEIEKSFLEYNYEINFDNYSIETILNLDPESGLYSDLSYPINMLQTDSSDDDIFDLQNAFLCYCKKMISEDIIKHLKEVNQKDNDLLPITKNKKISESQLLNGIKLNLADRFRIVNKLFNVSKKIEEFNILDREKDQLLSYILGCNISNARQLKSGIYNAKIRNEEIDNYLQSLNK